MGEGFETMRFKRNLRVGLFVLAKVIVVAGLYVWMSTSRLSATEEGGIRLEQEGEEKETKLEITILPSSVTSIPPSFESSIPSRPLSKSQIVLASEAQEEEEAKEAEEDLPWIFLAVSLILHLSVVLFDRGALDPIGQGILELVGAARKSGNCRWVALGAVNLMIVGSGRKLYGMVMGRRADEKAKEGGDELMKDEKSQMVVLTI